MKTTTEAAKATTPRKRPISFPFAVSVRLRKQTFDKLNECADREGIARAILCRRWIEERVRRC